MDKYKTCTKCKVSKIANTDNFYADKGQSSGLKPECKTCTLSHKKIFYQENRELLRLRAKRYRTENPSRWKEIKKRFREKNPESSRNDKRKRIARKKAVEHKPYTTAQVLALYGTLCHLCNEPIDLNAPRWTAKTGYQLGLHLDHVIRLSEGGPDTIENIRPAHAICNQIKN